MIGDRVLIVAVIAVNMASWGFAYENNNDEELSKYQHLWNTVNISDYSYVYTRKCFCSSEYTQAMRIYVKQEKIIRAEYMSGKQSMPNEIRQQLLTIKEWFGEIQKASNSEYGSVRVSYDEVLGYPVDINIDPHQRRADDEYSVTISDVIYP